MSKTIYQKVYQAMKSKTQEVSFVKHYQRHLIKLFFLFPFKTFQHQFNLMSTSINDFASFI